MIWSGVYVVTKLTKKCLDQPEFLNPQNTELWVENLRLGFVKVFSPGVVNIVDSGRHGSLKLLTNTTPSGIAHVSS